MSTSSVVINNNIEIISALCQNNNASAITFEGILTGLQSLFPSTGWTGDLLLHYLNKGIRQGLYIAVGGNPAGPIEGYAINPNALSLNNPRNFVYEPFCNQIRPIGCCPDSGRNSNVSVGAGSF